MATILHWHLSSVCMCWAIYFFLAKEGQSLYEHNEAVLGSLAVRGTLLTASPECQSKGTVLCVAEVVGH